jgi:uncharacterized Ntn-hydrolase superfamily protein
MPSSLCPSCGGSRPRSMRSFPLLASLALLVSVGAIGAVSPASATFSIVARDPATGNLGVAVQSHWFQVGTVVTWAEAGVGAVATQSFVQPAYGPDGLKLMREGVAPKEALDRLVEADEQRDVRQVAFVDAEGRVSAWTGDRCIRAAGHETGDGFSVQANLMVTDRVWPAMARAYRQAVEEGTGDFAERLLLALEAAQAEGGDIRGRQSAALLIVRAEPTGEPWRDVLVDLRVDDNPEPLKELRRLLVRHRAYEAMNAGDEAMAEGDIQAAVDHYSQATEMAPDIAELPFWKAVTLFTESREEEALPIFRHVFAVEPRWVPLVPRLPASGLLPDDKEKIQKILSVAP